MLVLQDFVIIFTISYNISRNMVHQPQLILNLTLTQTSTLMENSIVSQSMYL